MTAIRRMWAVPRELNDMEFGLSDISHGETNVPVLVMTEEAAEQIFQAARQVHSSGEGTNSYEYASAEEFINTKHKKEREG